MLTIIILVCALVFAVVTVRKLSDIDDRLKQLLAEREN